MSDTGKWGDLAPRVASGLAMVAVGAVALWLGGYVFAALGVLIGGLAVWELMRMVRPRHETAARQEAALAGFALAAALFVPGGVAVIILGLLLIVLIGRTGKYPLIVGGYTALIFLGVYGLVTLRNEGGLPPALWLVGVVIATDIAGYFAGRIIGGPKFWPKVSPKKTWAGIIAGWIAAALVSLWYASAYEHSVSLMMLAGAVLSFASQMGDAAESAIKRKMKIKDSSNLIPGHGGVMDRFDAMLGASVAVTLWLMVAGLG
ncbi:CDP-archaeol synthase [Alisedimentitalea sp. MJ-SS2]|uniref:phosphatidate cytidylyltransferase n=1 Tax=Aliisedimentitalea sp. MJ-SS2 TaxID=3049795 RepID=UPI0029060A32|nr:CDP-archaeol synthase [Alisedimentitalea sp. MJ-SS2]MDU8929774.1 CDP-archaeol synthase [Alisedimentitalea sp. MJ-SS2]